MNRSLPAAISVAVTKSPALRAAPLVRASVPAAGSVVIFTARSVSGGVSFGSLKPKSAAPKRYAPSSSVVTVLLAPCGASFTEITLTSTVATLESA